MDPGPADKQTRGGAATWVNSTYRVEFFLPGGTLDSWVNT